MNKSRERLLPPKVNLEMAVAELGSSDISQIGQQDILFQYQNDLGLILKLGGHYKFPGQMVSDGLEEITDSYGNRSLLTQGPTHWIDSGTDEIELEGFLFMGDSHVLISSVSVKGIEYYAIDEPQMHPKSIICASRDVYIDKEDFVDFRDGDSRKAPGWADSASEQFAPELALAVKVHKALRVDGLYPNEKIMLARVITWLEEHMPGEELGDGQKERIATIIGDARQQSWPKK